MLRHPGLHSTSYVTVEEAYLTGANSVLNVSLQEDDIHKSVQVAIAFIKNMENNSFIDVKERSRVRVNHIILVSMFKLFSETVFKISDSRKLHSHISMTEGFHRGSGIKP